MLHIMGGFGGGITSFIRNKAEYIKNENIQFDVATYDECSQVFVEAIEETGGRIYTLQNPKTKGWNAFRESYTRPLRNNDYDIIYSHINGYRVLPYFFYTKKYTNATFYVHSHNSHYPQKMLSVKKKMAIKLDQKINSQTTDKIVGCGELSIRSIFGKDVPRKSMMIIPNSVDVGRFIKDKESSMRLRRQNRTVYQFTDDVIVIGHIGRLQTVKNHELTIKLAHYIKEQGLSMKILIIGEGNRENELKKIVSIQHLDDVITFTGLINPIEDFIPTLDVMLLPSFTEGLPTVVVEAQASGVPVVMSNTITDEVDLGFEMIESVPLKANMSDWITAINKTQNATFPDETVREERIKSLNFSNETSASLYVDFLRGNISNYTIN